MLSDEDKTKEQLINELAGLRQRLTELEESETERKQMEEALRESEERYRDLFENANDLIQSVNPDGRFLYVNRTWREALGYTQGEISKLSLFDIIHPDSQAKCMEEFQRVVSGGSVDRVEATFVTKAGKKLLVEGSANCKFVDGKPVATRGIFRDITERKRAEERERQLQEELNLSSRLASIGELAAGVAHEINNPLTGIIGFSERLLRKNVKGETSRDLERIHNEALRAARVVENLHTFARRHERKKEYSDINGIVQKSLELRAYELKTSNIELVVELTPDLPEVMADFQQIQQVFLNLILNAEQAMTEANGGGKLTMKTQRRKGCIQISFTDDGPGISAEHLGKLFDPFFTTRGEKGGTGLGLSVCHGILAEHGGRIYAKSQPGEGATFFVELPRPPNTHIKPRLKTAIFGLQKLW